MEIGDQIIETKSEVKGLGTSSQTDNLPTHQQDVGFHEGHHLPNHCF